jgi:glycosyltransferase involved in cell wall biosynthesis
MRVAIDARTLLGRKTGDRSYAKGLIFGLAEIDRENQFLLCFDREPPASALPDAPTFEPVVIRSRHRLTWTPLALPRRLEALGADVLHVQYTVPPRCPCPVISTVHDVSFRLFPDWFHPWDRWLLDLGVRLAARRAARILTGTRASRADLISTHHPPPERVIVTPYAAEERFRRVESPEALQAVRDKYAIAGPFALYVGVLQPRKNLVRLIRAFVAARGRLGFQHRLILAGKLGWKYHEILALLQEPEVRNHVLHIGYVDDEDLPALYSVADLAVLVSLHEGFGIPALEAMACGTPVLVSDIPALAEVAGDAAVGANPVSEDDIGRALGTVLTDPALQRSLRERGLLRAGQFSWRRTAEATLAVYREVAAESS